MTLTPAGETLLHHARQMLFNVEKMGPGTGRAPAMVCAVMCGCWPISRRSFSFCRKTCGTFPARAPAGQNRPGRTPSAGVIQGVLDGVADLGICSSDTDIKGLHSVIYRLGQTGGADAAGSPLASRAKRWPSPIPWTAMTSACTPPARSTCVPTPPHAEAGKVLRLRIHVPGFDAMCRMVQANMGIGVLPQRAYELFGRALGLHGGAAQRRLVGSRLDRGGA